MSFYLILGEEKKSILHSTKNLSKNLWKLILRLWWIVTIANMPIIQKVSKSMQRCVWTTKVFVLLTTRFSLERGAQDNSVATKLYICFSCHYISQNDFHSFSWHTNSTYALSLVWSAIWNQLLYEENSIKHKLHVLLNLATQQRRGEAFLTKGPLQKQRFSLCLNLKKINKRGKAIFSEADI